MKSRQTPIKKRKKTDAVDVVLKQWQVERPDLDCTPMGVFGRIGRCAALIRVKLDATFSQFEMTGWEFDVLATLRRSGSPYCMAPTALFSALMITSGTMTHRLQGLEKRSLVERIPNPQDARSMLVRLTPEGFDLIDRAVKAHVENEHFMLASLNSQSIENLSEHLSTLLIALEELSPITSAQTKTQE